MPTEAKQTGTTVEHIAYANLVQCSVFQPCIAQLLSERRSNDRFALRAAPKEAQVRSLTFLIAICHRVNWDFLLDTVAEELSALTGDFDPDAVQELTKSDLARAFTGYRRSGESLALGRRLELLKETASVLKRVGWARHLCSLSRVDGEDGILTYLDDVPAYSEDPLRKKTHALIHELIRRKLISVVDDRAIQPAVDYHIMRLYLRTGRVLIPPRELHDRLVYRRRVRIEAVTAIRLAVAEAMRFTATTHGVSLSVLNDAEWAFARRHCRRDDVACTRDACPLSTHCPSNGRNPLEMITEPSSRHGFY